MDKRMTAANYITIGRLFLLPFIVYFLIQGRTTLSFVLMAIMLFSDVLDGYLARTLHQESELGRVLDPVCDKLSLMVIIVTMLAINAMPWWAAVVIILRDILILLGSYVLWRRRMVILGSNILGKVTGFAFGAMILALMIKLRRLGWILLYVCIALMLATFISYMHRYCTVMRKGRF